MRSVLQWHTNTASNQLVEKIRFQFINFTYLTKAMGWFHFNCNVLNLAKNFSETLYYVSECVVCLFRGDVSIPRLDTYFKEVLVKILKISNYFWNVPYFCVCLLLLSCVTMGFFCVCVQIQSCICVCKHLCFWRFSTSI